MTLVAARSAEKKLNLSLSACAEHGKIFEFVIGHMIGGARSAEKILSLLLVRRADKGSPGWIPEGFRKENERKRMDKSIKENEMNEGKMKVK